MKHITIGGKGEVGTAIRIIFNGSWVEKEESNTDNWGWQTEVPGVMHVCIPYSEKFVLTVVEYAAVYNPAIIVIHSSVPIGTCASIAAYDGLKVVHSPIRGLHPHLYEGIKTFVKFIGGEHASLVADEFRRHGLKVMLFDKAETTELGKLLDTEYYRACIEFTHRAKELSDKYGVPFHEAYTLFNMTYNEGYTKLNHPEYVRPVLQPIAGPIGGHCLLPNKTLLENG